MSSPQLQYAPRPPMHHRRSFLKWIAFSVFLIIAGSAYWWFAPSWRHLQLLYWQHRCMVYDPPPSQLIFASDHSTQLVPSEWTNFYMLFSPPGFVSQGTIFMHEMTKPDGQKRLVVVDYAPSLSGGTVQLGRVFKPGNAFRWPQEVTMMYPDLPIALLNPSCVMKTFAGRLDPNDSSHFSFQIYCGQTKLIYDGWLQNDERVIIGSRKPM